MKLRLKFLLIYTVFGILWILTSDNILIVVTNNKELINSIQTYKGIFYVLMTGAIFYLLLTHELNIRTKLLNQLTQANKSLGTEIEIKEKALKKAEENDNLKSAFLSNISHEIRTPMNGIVGFSELLDAPDTDIEAQKEYIRYIKASSKQLLNLVIDILDISKIQADQLEIVNSTFDLNKLLDSVYSEFERDLKSGNSKDIQIKLIKQICNDPLMIYSDPKRLTQVFEKMLQNAFSNTIKGVITFGYTLTDNKMVNFFVQDTGKGIPEEQLEYMFNAFRKFEDSTTRVSSGVGLGLSICKGIVDKLNGSITVDSELKKGTRFNFTIPILYENYIDSNEVQSQNTASVNNKWNNKTILIAEDDELNYLYLFEILKNTGATLIHAKNGQEVLELFIRIDNIDLVLMDLSMPVLDGFDALEQIRVIYGKVPVIAQTAYADLWEQQKCLDNGFNDFISKPINRKALLEMIENQFVAVN